MSVPTLGKVSGLLRAALVDVAWAQWGALGMGAANAGRCRAVVDPEALVLASLWLDAEEPRLWRAARLWARSASRLLSVGRIKNLLPSYPFRTSERLPAFALECLSGGKDARWKGIVDTRTASGPQGWKKNERATPALDAPASLVLRLRLAMGVGIKADVLACMIGYGGGQSTIRGITEATGYYRRAVQRSVEELVAARFLVARPTAPATYYADDEGWLRALELGDEAPLWRHWHQLFTLGGALDAAASATASQSPMIQASRARDVLEQYRAAFDLNAVPLGDPAQAPGEAYLGMLHEDVAELVGRIEKNYL